MTPSRISQKIHAMVMLMTTSNSPISMAAIFVATGVWQRVSKEFYRMKKAAICALLAVAVVCCGATLYAQQDNMGQMNQGQSGGAMGHHPMITPDQRLQHLTHQLNLTSDQQQKIKPMLEQEQQKLETLRQDTTTPQQDKRDQMQQIRQGTNDQIKAVLNPDQQTKFTQLLERRMPPGGPGGGGMGQGAPQQAPSQQ
jgi:periplasmic protein CpxP/Spy